MNYRPTYEITLGNQLLSTRANNRLVELSVHAGLEVPVNECRITLPRIDDMKLETGSPVSVKLGYDQQTNQVFAGTLSRIELGTSTLSLTARSVFRKLVKSRVNLFFENPTAGEMATEICRQFGIQVGNLGAGLRFSAYALGQDRAVYGHLKYLADQCGFDLYADSKDRLVFAQALPMALHPFEYGANIISVQIREDAAPEAKWEVYGESPASTGQGPQGASWFTKKEVKGSAGIGSEVVRRVFAPTIRTLDNATRMAQALQEKQKNRKRGTLRVTGAPEVQAGDTIQLQKMPETQHNGMFKVVALHHQLNAGSGFLSHFKIQAL